MNRIVSLLLILIAAGANAQVKYRVELSGKEVGTASLKQRLLPDGTKSVELKLSLKSGDQPLTIRSEATYDAKGNPIRKFIDSNIPGGKLQRQTVATFDSRGANLVVLDGGKRTTRQIPLVESAPRANDSEFWFLRQKPAVGKECRTYVFNMDLVAWQLQTVTYKGKKSIRLNGRSISCHVIETSGERTTVAYVDDQGLPWILESGAMSLKRIEEKS
ncbi:MAG TPA: hypothetical protein VJ835_12470 [Fimbriimonadaceae bacterium]|nr:hypothetical protein [Fimbriimonadaceae bacterium]